MKRTFGGGLQVLKELIEASDHDGIWSDENGHHVFHSENGGVLGYWPKTKTIVFQGKSPGREDLQATIDDWESSKPTIDDFFE